MKKTIRQLLSLILVLALVCGMMPSAFAGNAQKATKVSRELTAADYAATDAVWNQIELKETQLLAKKAPQKKLTESAINIVKASKNYVAGSLVESGDSFTWKTTEGISCHYSPRLRTQMREAKLNPDYDPNVVPEVETVSYAKKGGSPSGKNVYLIEPYYGLDTSFTTQYQTEASSIAKATGGTYTLYKTTNATITNVANAIADGAVVIFDSHGNTDYSNNDDCVSKATTSYLCLQTGTGITTADYNNNHALYAGSSGSMKIYEVDGTAITNHISGTCPNNIVWMAICLGMATDGLNKPLRNKGVQVVYGYSQSVSFIGDYQYEANFWTSMKNGATVASAISTMKSKLGNWDYNPTLLQAAGYSSSQASQYGYSTITTAKNNYAAFPIVASGEDVYPGHGNVDALQTVKSTWTLVGSSSSGSGSGTGSDSGSTTANLTVSYSVPAGVTKPADTKVASGASFTLPTPSGKPSADTTKTYTFVGWATSSVDNTTTAPTTYTGNVSTSASLTLYAVYSYTSSSKTYYTSIINAPAATTTYTVTYNVPTGVTKPSTVTVASGGSVTLPTPSGKPTADTTKTYTFAGWATSTVNNTTTAPTLYTAGKSYTVSGNLNLYAVYTYTGTGSSTGTTTTSYNLVTSASQLTTGATVVIASSDYAYAMSTTQNTNNRGRASITKSSGTMTPTSTVAMFTLKAGSAASSYAFYDSSKGGYLATVSSSANYLRTVTSLNANSSWKISVTSAGVATITGAGSYTRNQLKYNKSSGIFSCYNTTQSPVALYVKTTSTSGSTGATYYTSVITAPATTTPVVTAVSNNTSYGTVSVSGNVITAKPASGYHVESAAVTSGTGSCSVNGNTITVTATTNVTVTVTFAKDATTSTGTTYNLVTSASALTSGSYILIVKAGGSNKGSYTYYAMAKALDSTSYVKALGADSVMGTGAAPSSITLEDTSATWTLTGTSTSFTLTDGSNVLNNSNNNLYYRTGTATKWSATYTSSTKTFKISSSGRYLGLRDDLALSSTSGNPRFRCNTSANTTSYQFYLYKK